MNYTLHQLKVFLQICESKSITKAAEALHLTQPAVSIQLKRLQDQFEIPLTEVIGRQLYVTDFGNKIAEVSTRILEEADEIKTTVDQYKGLLSGKIHISVVSTGKYVMPYFLYDFAKQHPQVNISIDVTNKYRVLESLAKNETDFSLVSVLPEDMAIVSMELMENQLFFVGSGSEGHLLKSDPTPEDLHLLPLIFREKGSATRAAMERYLSEHQVVPQKAMELVSNEAVKQAVNAGLGFSIMPLIGLKNELLNGDIKIYPMKDLPITTHWNLIHNKGKKLSPAAEAFTEFLVNTKERVMETNFSWTKQFLQPS